MDRLMQNVMQCFETSFCLWSSQAHGSVASLSSSSDELLGEPMLESGCEVVCFRREKVSREDFVFLRVGDLDFLTFLDPFFFPFFDFFAFLPSLSESSSLTLEFFNLFSFKMSEKIESLVYEVLKKEHVC